jgi:hypothetical protein
LSDPISTLAEDKGTLFPFQTQFPIRLRRSEKDLEFLVPYFISFEDPEYNRRLVSRTSRTFTKVGNAQVTFALDRGEYNPESELIWGVKLDPSGTEGVQFSLHRNDPRAPELPGSGVFNLEGGRLIGKVSLARCTLLPGDTLFVILLVGKDQKAMRVTVPIVAEPVIPSPEAFYALLRKENSQVECRRAAWSARADRYEMVAPAELFGEIVRRRGVFLWTDTCRRTKTVTHEIQKIAANGATHFPFTEVASAGTGADFVSPTGDAQ